MMETLNAVYISHGLRSCSCNIHVVMHRINERSSTNGQPVDLYTIY